MLDSHIRAPIQILEEVLGEPYSDDGDDQSSTLFVATFEGEEFAVLDFHDPEGNEHPECLTDPKYVWRVRTYVDGNPRDVARFCSWLSGEVMKRVPSYVVHWYQWPLPGDPLPTPPASPKPQPKAVPPRVRVRNELPMPLPTLEMHRRRTAALQDALDSMDTLSIAELRSDLSRLSEEARTLAEWLASQPELTEMELRERLGRKFESACDELDALLRAPK